MGLELAILRSVWGRLTIYNLRTKIRLANRFAILIMAPPSVYTDAADMCKLVWPTYDTNETPPSEHDRSIVRYCTQKSTTNVGINLPS